MSNDIGHYANAFTLDDIFKGPIISVVKADFQAARKFVTFVKQYGFEDSKDEDGKDIKNVWDFGKLRMIKFCYHTIDSSGATIKHEIEIPAISMIPMPLLHVQEADFAMDMHILGADLKENRPPKLIVSDDNTDENVEEGHTFLASLAPLNTRNDNQLAPNLVANMKAKVKVRQADIPAGIAQILNLSQDANTGTVTRLEKKGEKQ